MKPRVTLGKRMAVLAALAGEFDLRTHLASRRTCLRTRPGTPEREAAVARTERLAARRNAVRLALTALEVLVPAAQRLERSWPEFDAVRRADLRRALRLVGARVSRD